MSPVPAMRWTPDPALCPGSQGKVQMRGRSREGTLWAQLADPRHYSTPR